MKKLLMFSLTVAAMCFAARADYIYWMLSNPAAAGALGTWDYAKIAVREAGSDAVTGYLTMGDSESQKAYADWTDPSEIDNSFASLGSFGSDGYSFLVELYNEATGEMIGANGRAVSYGDLLANDSIAGAIGMGGNAFDFSSVGYTIPEPTSGLMLLIGFSALALKRKRA